MNSDRVSLQSTADSTVLASAGSSFHRVAFTRYTSQTSLFSINLWKRRPQSASGDELRLYRRAIFFPFVLDVNKGSKNESALNDVVKTRY